MGPTLRVEPIGARVAPRCCAAKRGPSTRFEQTRPRPSKLGRARAAHPRPVVEDASHPRQCAADSIRRLFGAKRLTTSEFSIQSRRQTSLPPVLLLIRSALYEKNDMKVGVMQ